MARWAGPSWPISTTPVTEVEGLQFGERAARAQPVEDKHGQRRAQLVLPRGRDTPCGQQRGAEDQAGPYPLVGLAVQAAVVVRQRVEREVLDQPDRKSVV